MDIIKSKKELVRDYLAQRVKAVTAPPSREEIRRQLGAQFFNHRSADCPR